MQDEIRELGQRVEKLEGTQRTKELKILNEFSKAINYYETELEDLMGEVDDFMKHEDQMIEKHGSKLEAWSHLMQQLRKTYVALMTMQGRLKQQKAWLHDLQALIEQDEFA